MYKLICMSFDGEFKVEDGGRATDYKGFETIQDTWEWGNNIGSKWFFYPFYFVVTDSLKTIVDTPFNLPSLKHKKVSTVQKEFKRMSGMPELKNASAEDYAYFIEFKS